MAIGDATKGAKGGHMSEVSSDDYSLSTAERETLHHLARLFARLASQEEARSKASRTEDKPEDAYKGILTGVTSWATRHAAAAEATAAKITQPKSETGKNRKLIERLEYLLKNYKHMSHAQLHEYLAICLITVKNL